MASISYDHVTKRFTAEAAAVNDLSLEINDTEFMVLVGPSGCGKTTALRMLAGLEDVTEGEIRIGDQPVNNVPARDRDIAMVFQSYALYPHMTVFDNIGFGLRMRGKPASEVRQQVTEAAQILGLEELLKRKPRELSGGQRQRVALGGAIVRHPQVFLLDEPLSNLDAKLRAETRINLQKLHRRLGVTFVYVTHDQVEAMTMGDRIAVMRDGVLQQVATPREIYERPANTYVAGFVGSPPMSFVPVAISGRRAKASGFEIELQSSPGISSGLLGIRPEALGAPLDNRVEIEVTVDAVEMLGSDQFIYGTTGTDSLTGRVDPHTVISAGDRVRLGLDIRSVNLFDEGGVRR
jgi:multiple sugar transport system ATP-binding protein